MPTIQKPLIYLASVDPQLRRRWADCLEMAGLRCCQPIDGGQPLAVDLILTDGSLPEPPTANPCEARRKEDGRQDDGRATESGRRPAGLPQRDYGLILIGADTPDPGRSQATADADARLRADACLPADATDQEIERDCRLVLEIVRLRRENRSKSESGNALLQLALTDPLTGLGNRRAWHLALQRAWTQLRGGEGNVCLTILDLDQFKALNDSLGHAAGDRALQIAGHVLAAAVRKSDFAARLGGDEFGLIWMGVTDEAAGQIVERVRATLSDELSAANELPLTASAGYALATAGPGLPASDELLAWADAGLQIAKRLGRGRAQRGAEPPLAVVAPAIAPAATSTAAHNDTPHADTATRPAASAS